MINIEMLDNITWDYLPVIKIINYPWEQSARKIYAQARLAYKINFGLTIRMWSFETNPISNVMKNYNYDLYKDSLLSLALENKQKRLSVSFNKNGNYIINKNTNVKEKDIITDNIDFNCFNGEDLQGIYWGAEFLFSDEFFKKNLDLNIKNGEKFKINFIKNSYNENYFHCGGFVAVDVDDIFKNMAEVKVTCSKL